MNDADNKTPPTENKDELEHARQVAREMCADETDETYEQANFRYILREHAAAGKAAYERGRKQAESEIGSTLAITQDYLNQSAESLRKLQSQHKRLTAAAMQAEQAMREAADRLRAKHGYEPLAIIECADVLRDLVDAALAETEEKKT